MALNASALPFTESGLRSIGEALVAAMRRKWPPDGQTFDEAITEQTLRVQGYPIARGSLRITGPGQIAWTSTAAIESLVIRGEVTF